MTLLAYGDRAEEAVLAAAEEIHSLDDRLSTGNPESEISRINAAGAGSASEVVLYLVEQSRMLYDETGGLFDIAIYPVMKLWGFPTQDFRVPEKTEIEAALKLADASAISIETEPSATDKQAPAAEAAATGEEAAGTAATEEQAAASAGTGEPAAAVKEEPAAAEPEESPAETYPVLRFGLPGMEIDLGGIAKGYTGNRVMEIFKEHGISHGLISLGGNVQALGSKEDGSAWRVAIQNPESGQGYLGILDIKDKAVITSGGYERYFEQDGVRYHHIIDPRTGYPADSGLLSATIVSEDGTLADGLSTSLFIMGKEEAEKYWRVHPDLFDYILEDADGTLYVTEGAADLLTTDAKTVIIRR
ncbi:MAG: FAD:protein FMN transferase [Eubacteriales bacterium]|nr:FAD:protein FMN transferase [Eubacteriales bacterium]